MSARTTVCEIKDGIFRSYEIEPEQFGFKKCSKEELVGGSPEAVSYTHLPTLRNRNIRGTHIVKFVVQVPEKMNAAQKEALRNFQEAMGEVAPSEKKEEAPHEKHEKHKKKGFFKK